MAQQRGSYPDHQSVNEDPSMDWQTDTGLAQEDIYFKTIEMRHTIAQMLLKLGLQQAIKAHFKLDLNMKIDSAGLQLSIPNNHKSKTEYLLQFAQNFFKQINCKPVPLQHGKTKCVLSQSAVRKGLVTAVDNTRICAYLDIDVEKGEFKVFAVSEDDIQKTFQIINDTLIELEIQIDDRIKAALSQDDRWRKLKESIESHSDNSEFTVAIAEQVLVITGLNTSVKQVCDHVTSIINEIQIDQFPQPNERTTDHVKQDMHNNTEGSIEVDFPVGDHNVFSYIKSFHNTVNGIVLEAYEENSQQGFTLKGLPADVETVEKLLKDLVNQIKDKPITFQDEGYFSKDEGQQFLVDTVETGCKVLCEPYNKEGSRNGSISQNQVRKTPTPKCCETDGHRLCIWKLEEKCEVVLAESKVEESSADVIVNIVDMKTPSSKIQCQTKPSFLKVDLPVPKYIPSPQLDEINNSFRKLFQSLVDDKHGSVAVSIDNAGSWPVVGIVPRIIRSFASFLRENEHDKSLKLSLLLCSTITDNFEKAEKIVQQILKEEYQKKKTDEKARDLSIQVEIVQGKLHETEADILVNTTAPNLDLSIGAVSKSLLSAAGIEMQREIYKKKRNYIELEPGEITVTLGYKLKCKRVIHGVLCAFEEEPTEKVYKKSVNQFVKVCLEEAAGCRCKTIAFPAIGTGKLEYPIDIVASEMFWAVEEFRKKHPDSTLKEVLFVLYPGDKDAIEVFKEKQAELLARYLEEQEPSCNSGDFQLIGPADNIEKAKQHIQDRLDLLQSKGDSQRQCNPVEIHGVSAVAYTLLRHFHGDVIVKWEHQGFVFLWEDDVLKISGYERDKSVVKAELEMFNEQVSTLLKATCNVKDIDPDVIDSFMARDSSEVCCVYNRVKQEVVICGKDNSLVQQEKKLLSDMTSASLNELQQKHQSNTKEESSKIITVEGLSEDIYLVLCEKYADMNEYVLTYDKRTRQAMVNKKKIKEFQRCLAEAKTLQRIDILIPDDKKEFAFKEDIKVCSVKDVVCVYDLEQLSVSVFGTNLNSVQEESHKIKIKAGVIGKTNRNKRQLTESYQAPDSPEAEGGRYLTTSVSQTSTSPRLEEHQNKTYQRTDSHAGGARPKDYFKKAPLIRGSYNSETFHTSESIPVKVYTKNILHLDVDCIVNAANDTLKHGGGIAKVISNAAGHSLAKECADHIQDKGKLKPGEVFVSNAGRLNYKCVIHAVGPCWTDYKPHTLEKVHRCEQDLKIAVLNSFKAAERKRMETIAVPAISSAIFAVPKDICTKMYAEAVIAYSKQAKSSTKLKEIHFVDSFPNIITSIQKRFGEMMQSGHKQHISQKYDGKSRPASPAKTAVTSKADRQRTKQPSSKSAMDYPFPYVEEVAYEGGFKHQLHCHFSKTLELIIDAGSVFDKAKLVDGIVCSDNKAGESKGYIAKALLDKGGNKYKMVKEKAFKWVKFGDVVVLKGDGTGFGKVFLAIMWNKDPGDSDFQRQEKFKKMFKSVFKKVIAEKCNSVVMPLLFTGQGKVNPDFCTDRFLESCMEFSKEETKSMLTIYLINNEKWKTETIERITKEFVNIQTALSLSTRTSPTISKPARPLPPRPANPEPGKQTSNPTNRTRREQEKQTNRNPKHISSRPHANQKQQRNSADIGRLSSSLQNVVVGSSNSKSKFYVDDDDDGTAQTYNQHTQEKSAAIDDEEDDDSDKGQDSQDENCVICMDTVTNPKKLKCGHVFCTDCIDSYFSNYKKVCPTCGAVCGVVKGDQPHGTMDVKFDKNFHCAGYERTGSIIITYSFNSGTQGPDHPNPGRPFKGITRVAYLPDNKEGREVLKMLEIAFDRKLVFTIGSSRTTGQEGVITWNDVHHKTNPKPNASFGYPDPGYLNRVKDELAVKGVTPEDIPQIKYTGRSH